MLFLAGLGENDDPMIPTESSLVRMPASPSLRKIKRTPSRFAFKQVRRKIPMGPGARKQVIASPSYEMMFPSPKGVDMASFRELRKQRRQAQRKRKRMLGKQRWAKENRTSVYQRMLVEVPAILVALDKVPAWKRRAVLTSALNAFRPGGAKRVELRIEKLRARGLPLQKAWRQALASELSATIMSPDTGKAMARFSEAFAKAEQLEAEGVDLRYRGGVSVPRIQMRRVRLGNRVARRLGAAASATLQQLENDQIWERGNIGQRITAALRAVRKVLGRRLRYSERTVVIDYVVGRDRQDRRARRKTRRLARRGLARRGLARRGLARRGLARLHRLPTSSGAVSGLGELSGIWNKARSVASSVGSSIAKVACHPGAEMATAAIAEGSGRSAREADGVRRDVCSKASSVRDWGQGRKSKRRKKSARRPMADRWNEAMAIAQGSTQPLSRADQDAIRGLVGSTLTVWLRMAQGYALTLRQDPAAYVARVNAKRKKRAKKGRPAKPPYPSFEAYVGAQFDGSLRQALQVYINRQTPPRMIELLDKRWRGRIMEILTAFGLPAAGWTAPAAGKSMSKKWKWGLGIGIGVLVLGGGAVALKRRREGQEDDRGAPLPPPQQDDAAGQEDDRGAPLPPPQQDDAAFAAPA
jgi:hypothetical protein